MGNTKNKKMILKRVFLYTFVLTFTVLVAGFASGVSAYNCKPGDTVCENAKSNMQANKNEAYAYTKKAETVGEIIKQLDSEISQLNASIAENEAKIAELNVEIQKTEKKLAENQAALAEMLINMHFNSDSEPITILAGSKSISDFAEKQAREDVAKQEIAAAGERVKETKAKLNSQREEAEKAIQLSKENKNLVASKRADQESLRSEYQQSANEASAVAKYWEKQVQALAWTPPSNTTGSGVRMWGANNTYPYRNNCPGDNVRYSAYGGAVCQCTSYASWKAKEKWGITNTWGGHARNYVNASGYYVPATGGRTYVDKNPAANTIAIQTGGAYGHVMWVESVNANGSINVTEYNVNWPSIGCNIGDFCSRSNVGSAGTWFLHFD